MSRLVPPPFRRVGIIAGNFDVIHPGYVRLFNDAKKNGCDKLIVALQGDPTIERPEKAKPILTSGERAEVLMSLSSVDEIIHYNTEAELVTLLKKYPEHIRVIGTDYYGKDFTGKELSSSIYYHDRNHKWSTTKFKTEIARQCIRQGFVDRE